MLKTEATQHLHRLECFPHSGYLTISSPFLPHLNASNIIPLILVYKKKLCRSCKQKTSCIYLNTKITMKLNETLQLFFVLAKHNCLSKALRLRSEKTWGFKQVSKKHQHQTDNFTWLQTERQLRREQLFQCDSMYINARSMHLLKSP